MAAEIRLQTHVLSGSRVEVTAPELPVGRLVEVVIRVPVDEKPESKQGVLDFLDSLPPVVQDWDAREREFQEERNSWDR